MKKHSLVTRVYALDALRAVMMLLGLLIHTAVTYMPYPSPVRTIMAKNTSPFFIILVNGIHTFRMPVFFVVAGFFGALLFYKKGPIEMLKNRVTKILIPLLVLVPIIYPMMYFTFTFSTLRITGVPDAFNKAVNVMTSGQFLPLRLSHMWFLYYLLIYSAICWCIAMIFRKANPITNIYNRIISYILSDHILRILGVAAVFLIYLVWRKTYFLSTNITFRTDLSLLVNYFIFYATGWMLFTGNLLEKLKWRPGLQLSVATVLFLISLYVELYTEGQYKLITLQVLNAFTTTIFTFGFLGLFLIYFNTYSPAMSYVMDSAYYVYLIHVPIAVLIPGLLTNMGLPLIIEYAITLVGTTAICFITFHFLVRNTFIGRFLKGNYTRSVKKEIMAGGGLERERINIKPSNHEFNSTR